MSDVFPPLRRREALLMLRDALGVRDNALKRDECGDWRVNGRQGHIYAVPEGFQIVFFARCGVTEWDGEGPHIEDCIRAKRSLIFCRLAQDGVGEGIFFLDRLPTSTEAEIIRGILAIAKKREAGEPTEGQMTARLAFASRARTSAQNSRPTEDRRPQDGPAGAGMSRKSAERKNGDGDDVAPDGEQNP
jgi:hypothetical protein